MTPLTFAEISLNTEVSHSYKVTADHYKIFLHSFGDDSPVHSDPVFAQSAGYPDVIMHAALLHGFLSHFCGGIFPGAHGTTLAVNISYKNPFYLNDELQYTVKVTGKQESFQVVSYDLMIRNLTQNTLTASARIQSKVWK
jgi:acyl dehydratase